MTNNISLASNVSDELNLYCNQEIQNSQNQSDLIINKFIKKLIMNEDGTSITQSEDGISGYTFFCTMLDDSSDDSSLNKFIMKFSITAYAFHEIAGRAFLSFCGFGTPDMEVAFLKGGAVNAIYKHISNMIQISKREEIEESRDLSNYSITIMNQIEGLNLRQFLLHANGTLKHWEETQRIFGTVAILDLFMGNCDRFFKDMASFSGVWNKGNIMIELNNHNPIFIDNVPEKGFIENPSESLEHQIADILKKNLPPKFKEKKVQLLRSKSKNEEPYFPIVELANKRFEDVIKGNKKQEFIKSIINGFDSPKLKISEENISLGLDNGIRILRNKVAPIDDITFIFNDVLDELSPVFLTLIKKNQRSIKSVFYT